MTTISRIKETAKQKGIKLSYICERLGFKSRTYFNDIEKNNREIPEDKLKIIAEELNTTVAYLKGETDKKEISTKEENFTEHEIDVIHAYRLQPNMQEAVDKLLGIEKDGKVLLWTAAQMPANKPDEIIAMDREKWSSIEQAPETDEELK